MESPSGLSNIANYTNTVNHSIENEVDDNDLLAQVVFDQQKLAEQLSVSAKSLERAQQAIAMRTSTETVSSRRSTQAPPPPPAAAPRSRGNSADSDISEISHSVPASVHPHPATVRPTPAHDFDVTMDKHAKLDRVNMALKQNLSNISMDSSVMKDVLSYKENIDLSSRNGVRASDSHHYHGNNSVRNSYDSAASVGSAQSSQSNPLKEMSDIDKRISSLQSYLENARYGDACILVWNDLILLY